VVSHVEEAYFRRSRAAVGSRHRRLSATCSRFGVAAWQEDPSMMDPTRVTYKGRSLIRLQSNQLIVLHLFVSLRLGFSLDATHGRGSGVERGLPDGWGYTVRHREKCFIRVYIRQGDGKRANKDAEHNSKSRLGTISSTAPRCNFLPRSRAKGAKKSTKGKPVNT
jgi:hypothetical protein